MANISCSDKAQYSDAQLPVSGNSRVNSETKNSGANGFQKYSP